MAEDTTRSPFLTDYLAQHYAEVKRRLTQLLRNSDLADDALQDTWLRLQAQPEESPPVLRSPLGFLLRVAVNIAVDIRRRQTRTLSWEEVSELQAMADPSPGPARTVEARSQLQKLLERVAAMPQRRQDIFVLVEWEGMRHKEVAERLGVSLRTVEYELKRIEEALGTTMRSEGK